MLLTYGRAHVRARPYSRCLRGLLGRHAPVSARKHLLDDGHEYCRHDHGENESQHAADEQPDDQHRGDTDGNGDDPAHRIGTRVDEAPERTDDEASDDQSDDFTHGRTLSAPVRPQTRLADSICATAIRGVVMEQRFAELKSRLAEIHDLRRTQEILFWDQTVMMPPGGGSVRGHQVTTLDRIAHEKFVSDEIGTLLEELADYE